MDSDDTVVQTDGWTSILRRHLQAQQPTETQILAKVTPVKPSNPTPRKISQHQPTANPNQETQFLPTLAHMHQLRRQRLLRYYNFNNTRILEVTGAAVRAVHPAGVEVADPPTNRVYLLPWHRVHELSLVSGDNLLEGPQKP